MCDASSGSDRYLAIALFGLISEPISKQADAGSRFILLPSEFMRTPLTEKGTSMTRFLIKAAPSSSNCVP